MALLSVQRLTKSFGGLLAVHNVSFDVFSGEIVGIIGPNGAGKTTVFNLITGIYKPDQGEIVFDQHSIVGKAPHDIVKLGIARTFQTIRLFSNLSVLENVMAGAHCRMSSGVLGAMLRLPGQRREEREKIEEAMELLGLVGLQDFYDYLAGSLSYGNQRLLEIARALATHPRLLILDEPAGGMNERETEELIKLIGKIRDKGVTVLLIEHDMNVVMKICERIVVLEYGSTIAEGTPEEIQSNPRVIEAYLGTDEDE
ncbi:MAG TPA: ABC transporter ATP-binding protein [Thermodesulforhabdus norvegica]|uniref:ABC transporter ATP-binding protein n=1 Tax=Thermodesulforhabdus norvegica TaxID=39841 RepID=A0A7C1AYZ2_9BACT|nr:ABC transporter ATP-binding protein [Deltaproteobacteria bacterium]MBW2067311.1 ABC transporter ATP-binding protein [Deltaproteobacteria bacterium]HDL90456.1 ABC transporter ATP-binding protein [Thermodesulforhabdus norvegica]